MPRDTWPFADAENTAVFTSADVIDRGMPILFVYHDEDDGAWQFHSARGAPEADRDARIVGLRTIVALDPSIAALADLPFGWVARREKDGSWRREQCRT